MTSLILKIDKKSDKNIGICNIGYITIKKIDDCKSVYTVNPLYLKNENKHFIVDENNEVLKNYVHVSNGIKNKIEETNVSECDYEKCFMKIKFNSDEDLPLNKH